VPSNCHEIFQIQYAIIPIKKKYQSEQILCPLAAMVNCQKVVATKTADATRVGINRWWDQVVQRYMQTQISVITYIRCGE